MTRTVGKPRTRDLPLDELREWPKNPRRISKPRLEQLKRALEAEPEMLAARPLIALPDGTVIAGNQRLRAARELGWRSLPVVTVDLDEARVAEWALRDNRSYGEDDEQAVGELLAELGAGGRDLDLTGYGSAEIDALLAAVRPAGATDPDEAPPVPVVPRSVRGEVYELGPHRVMCGDATSEADVAALLADSHAALLFTSPPYLDLRDYAGESDLSIEKLAKFLPVFADNADLIAFNIGIVVRDSEIVTFWDGYLAAAREAGLKLIAWNDVIDPFAGSGSTLIACEQLGRRALCMEIDPAYVDVIRQRYAGFTCRPELAP